MNNIHEIASFYQRDLLKLKEEIMLFPVGSLWKTQGIITNSAGNLTLHLCGNLDYFIGTLLGQTGYIRHRELEFSQKDLPKDLLMNMIDDTIHVVSETLSKLDDAILDKEFPVQKNGITVSTNHMLLHLMIHLGYHLGQVNYCRRMIHE